MFNGCRQTAAIYERVLVISKLSHVLSSPLSYSFRRTYIAYEMKFCSFSVVIIMKEKKAKSDLHP